MVLVVGATGLLGGEICRQLAAKGEKIRAFVRRTSSSEKLAALTSIGAELFVGDLKDSAPVRQACQGVDAVISTASSTLSRQAGDSIESVDHAGQLNLVAAAENAAVQRFVFVSFRRPAGLSFPLGEAKRTVEDALRTRLNFSIIQASWFMEVWLSAAFGFDYTNATARIYGPGTSPVSWVSYRDVAQLCCTALRHPAAERQFIECGGPEALSPLQVVARFEKLTGKKFKLEHVPAEILRAQFEQATDSMQKSIAALMLGYLHGDAMNMATVVAKFGLSLTHIDNYAQSAIGKSARA